MYADDEFQALAAWCRDVCDEAGGSSNRTRMHGAFLASSEHELAFWDAAWAA
jgi:thiaminase/transcriptional activator TenA